MEKEIWKDVFGYEGIYKVSNQGAVRNKDKIMNPTSHCTGYKIIGLSKNKKQRIFRLHRIVAAHFCYKKEGCDIVNHINGVKIDNRADNLEWTTISGNTYHSFKMGLQKARRGEDSNFSILSELEVLEIREKYKSGNFLQKDLGSLYKVSRNAITAIVNKKNWTHI